MREVRETKMGDGQSWKGMSPLGRGILMMSRDGRATSHGSKGGCQVQCGRSEGAPTTTIEVKRREKKEERK